MSLHRILGLLLRYLLLYRQSWTRVMEIFFWPVMDLLAFFRQLRRCLRAERRRRVAG
jgi:hypothetical protein